VLALGVPVDVRDGVDPRVALFVVHFVTSVVHFVISDSSKRGLRHPGSKKKPALAAGGLGRVCERRLSRLRTSNHRALTLIAFETNDDHLPWVRRLAFVSFMSEGAADVL
jgi:hypothetical protein